MLWGTKRNGWSIARASELCLSRPHRREEGGKREEEGKRADEKGGTRGEIGLN
jgi:hypothetical protein